MTAPVLFQFMPPLLPSEYASLTESIRAHGVQVPVLVDENGAIIDGHHRDQIAAELGIDCPRDVRAGLTEADKRTLAISLNKDRRHLTREQVRALLAESVKADPQLSDREHARRVGVHNETVASVRRELEATGDVTDSVTRTDSLGRQQPATKPERIDPATGEVLEPKETYTTERKDTTPPRKPLRDGFRDAALDLDKIVHRFQRLASDDRLTRNKNEVARYANDLTRAIDALQRVTDQIS